MGLLRARSSGIAAPPTGRDTPADARVAEPAGADTAAAQLPAGTYVTDERRLFRVVRSLATERGKRAEQDELDERRQRLLELEDCRTLELVLCAPAALARAGLRRVVPAVGA